MTMRAKWPGRCTRTGKRIRVGDDIASDGRGGWVLVEPTPDPLAGLTLSELHAKRVQYALRRRPDLKTGQP